MIVRDPKKNILDFDTSDMVTSASLNPKAVAFALKENEYLFEGEIFLFYSNHNYLLLYDNKKSSYVFLFTGEHAEEFIRRYRYHLVEKLRDAERLMKHMQLEL